MKLMTNLALVCALSAALAACDRGANLGANLGRGTDSSSKPTDDRPQTANLKGQAPEFPSIGAARKAANQADQPGRGSFPTVGTTGGEPLKPSNGRPQTPPMDGNGIVGSPMASTIDSKAMSAPPSSEINVSGFSFAKREQFKALMQSRIQAVDQGVKSLEASPEKNTVSTKNIAALKDQEGKVNQRLNEVGQVSRAQWDGFKTSFRDDVVGLERSYQEMATARR